jgi:hypothetical protein
MEPNKCLLRHLALAVHRCLLTTPMCEKGSNCQGAETCDRTLRPKRLCQPPACPVACLAGLASREPWTCTHARTCAQACYANDLLTVEAMIFFLVHKKRIVLVLVMWSHSRALLVLSTLFLIALSRPIGVRTSPTVEAMMPMIPSAITANGSDPGLNSSAGNRPHCGLPTTCLLRHFGLPVRRCLLTTPICGNGSNCQGAETCEWALPQAAVPTIWLRRS